MYRFEITDAANTPCPNLMTVSLKTCIRFRCRANQYHSQSLLSSSWWLSLVSRAQVKQILKGSSMLIKFPLVLGFTATVGLACDDCHGSRTRDVTVTRHRPRMQPDAQGAVSTPKAPLEWGQINFLHTTDTHGWLEGHVKEQNYGADWGDWVSFVEHLNQTAINAGVDLLLIDTGKFSEQTFESALTLSKGDLHDGAGLSDSTSPNGELSNPIFENINYDLLTIGNHELYVTEIAYETFNQFAKAYGERYLTSNVQILNPSTNQLEYIGQQYRYFTTRLGQSRNRSISWAIWCWLVDATTAGLRIMAFGFLYDFTGNSNVSRVITARDSVNSTWFTNAVNYPQPIDLFVVLGHNPPRPTVSGSTFGTIYNAIRQMRPDVPIQVFGGHTHVRDFVVYDDMATGIESGRYCETLGWLAVSGLPGYGNLSGPVGLPHPTQTATKTAFSPSPSSVVSTAQQSVTATLSTGPSATATASGNSTVRYARRYLDWNRLTFEYHSNTSQVNGLAPTSAYKFAPRRLRPRQLPPSQEGSFDTPQGTGVTNTIYQDRQQLNLTALYGCAPQNWCQSCAPFLSPGNIFSLLTTALQQIVVNPNRTDVPRMVILNTGSVRFDLFKGPFTFDDSFIVSPFTDTFQYIANVPFNYANVSPQIRVFRRSKLLNNIVFNSKFWASWTPALSSSVMSVIELSPIFRPRILISAQWAFSAIETPALTLPSRTTTTPGVLNL